MRLLRQITMDAAICVMNMRSHGMLIDTERMHNLQLEKLTESAALDNELQRLVGDPYFNPRSHPQCRKLLYEKMAIPKHYNRGKATPTTDDDALMDIGGIEEVGGELIVKNTALPERTEVCLLILNSRRAGHVASTYYSLNVDPDNRVHPDWRMSTGDRHKGKDEEKKGGTATGRYTCYNPPIQTYPPKARCIFTAPEGQELAYYDLSQIEFRIMISRSKDPTGTELLAKGGDIHRLTAAELYKVSPSQVTPDQRFQAKFVNFGLPYGRGPDSLAKQHKLTLIEAQAMYDKHHSTFPVLWEWLNERASFARQHHYIENIYHRRRWFIDDSDDERDRKAFNFEPQSTAHDLLMQIHADVSHKVPQVHVVADMHDALLVEQPLCFDIGLIKNIFERERIGGLSTPCGVKVAKDWGEMGR